MEHKVVFNECYGGFSLSEEAVHWLEENARQEIKDFLAKEKEELEKDDSFEEFITTYDILSDCLVNRLPRHDKDLVACVEALGDKASASYASLSIAEITGNEYRIEEYDGYETVVTPDMIQFIKIEDEA